MSSSNACAVPCCDLKRFTKLLSSLNGRDKFSKVLQNASKVGHYLLQSSKAETALKLQRLSSGISHSRKVDRLLKSAIEVQKILDTVKSSQNDPLLSYLIIASSSIFFVHWCYDNRLFLGKLKVINIDMKATNKTSSKYQLLGLIIVLFTLYYKIRQFQQKIGDLKYDAVLVPTESSSNDRGDDRHKLRAKIRLHKLMMFGSLCDAMIASHGSGAVEYLTGSGFKSGTLGTFGLLSAFATLYRIY